MSAKPVPSGLQLLAAAIASDDVGIPEMIAALRQKCLAAGVTPSGNLRALLHQADKDKAEINAWWARVMDKRKERENERHDDPAA